MLNASTTHVSSSGIERWVYCGGGGPKQSKLSRNCISLKEINKACEML